MAGNTVTSKRASLKPEKVEDKVLKCGWVRGQKSKTLGEVVNLHVYIEFCIIVSIIFFIFLERKMGNFCESFAI